MNLRNFTDRFIQERRILTNVSPATVSCYTYSLKAFQPVLETEFESLPILSIGALQQLGRDNKAVSINT